MFRTGQLVKTLTPKIGQAPRVGRVRKVEGEFVEVEWEDGRLSTLTKESVVPHKKEPAGRR